MNQILTPEEVTSIRKDALASRSSTLPYNLQIVEDLCDTIEALRARLHEVDAENEKLQNHATCLESAARLAGNWAKHGATCRGFTGAWIDDSGSRQFSEKFPGSGWGPEFDESKCSCGVMACRKAVNPELWNDHAHTWKSDAWFCEYRAVKDTNEALRARLHEVDAEAERLHAFAESVPGIWEYDAVGGRCHACLSCERCDVIDISISHKPDCLYVRAQAALAPEKAEGETDA